MRLHVASWGENCFITVIVGNVKTETGTRLFVGQEENVTIGGIACLIPVARRQHPAVRELTMLALPTERQRSLGRRCQSLLIGNSLDGTGKANWIVVQRQAKTASCRRQFETY